ncbi:unnamed protein product [Spirodela intermedia]|uniref:Uncharacterized protein n=1 Tax=Spirodela intermedia TaxID=51605 RepID=A0A7I8IYM9_SPIIN|nr:unnamed protein product [Spirodela intermedia]CAA6662899.1 unnamed protein product [Spirodela intermedia]
MRRYRVRKENAAASAKKRASRQKGRTPGSFNNGAMVERDSGDPIGKREREEIEREREKGEGTQREEREEG